MSLSVIHFNRNPKPFCDKTDDFAVEVGCELRFVGSKGKHSAARVLVHEWQLDLLDQLPLCLLLSSHVVVAEDWRAGLLRKLRRQDTRIKHEMSFF